MRLLSSEKSPAERIVDLVKKAEENFEKSYGRGFPAVPAKSCHSDHEEEEEEEDDMVV